jgi:hypothetical protein
VSGSSSGRPTHANRGRHGSEREAARLRRHREEYRYALEHDLTILEARRRLNRLAQAAFERLQNAPLKPGRSALCGTEAPAMREAGAGPESRPHFWWEDR